MSITISMENIVYEDALTILSYASPYPVLLRLQRPAPLRSTSTDATLETEMSEDLALHHPQYRSQSLDDLRKLLGRSSSELSGDEAFGAIPSPLDQWAGPRKTWSEHKRPRDAAEGKLRKWLASQDIVHEEVATSPSQQQLTWNGSTDSVPAGGEEEDELVQVYTPTLQAPAEDGSHDGDSTILAETDSIEQVPYVILNGDDKKEEGEEALSDLMLKPIGASSENLVRDKKLSESSDASLSTLSRDSIGAEKPTVANGNGTSDHNKNKLDKVDAEFVRESMEAKLEEEARVERGELLPATDASLLVNVSNSNLSEVEEDNAGSEYSGDSMRAVLKDYFGDQPTLLEKLGYAQPLNGPPVRPSTPHTYILIVNHAGKLNTACTVQSVHTHCKINTWQW